MPNRASLALLWRDKWLSVAAGLLLWQARITLTFSGFGRPRETCQRTANLPPAPPALLRRVNRSVECARRLVPKPTCLVQAMAAQRLLALKGFGSEIRVGVRKTGTKGFEAHAWLVSGNALVLGGSADEIRAFQPLIGSR